MEIIVGNGISHESLKKKDSLLGVVLNSIFDGIYITDQDKRILFWNNGSENYTGYKSSEVLGQKCSDDILVHTDDDGKEENKARKDITVIGDTVNTASRIESITTPNSIFISATTYQKLPSNLTNKFKFNSEVAVKGKRKMLAVYKYQL